MSDDAKPDSGAAGPARLDLGKFGSFGRGVTPQQAAEIEALGYGAVWVGGSPPAELDWVEPILEQTTTLKVATGIVNIWTAAPGPVAESFHRIEAAYPGRFLLGIGVGHPEAHQQYQKPIDALNTYLDKLDALYAWMRDQGATSSRCPGKTPWPTARTASRCREWGRTSAT